MALLLLQALIKKPLLLQELPFSKDSKTALPMKNDSSRQSQEMRSTPRWASTGSKLVRVERHG
jgi:hypothetical protein